VHSEMQTNVQSGMRTHVQSNMRTHVHIELPQNYPGSHLAIAKPDS
jgi:hypothetical protein